MIAKNYSFIYILAFLICGVVLLLLVPLKCFSQRPTRPGSLRSTRSTDSVQGDRDRDGLTDEEELKLKTDPNNQDTDGDGLLDGWEVHGVNEIKLGALNASPLHKDIFVEMDYMNRASATYKLMPDGAVLSAITEIFAAAPVSNPDGRPGISIHLELGNEVPYDDDLNPLFLEFAELKDKYFDPKRAPVFHYMIWANGYDAEDSSGYSMNIPHSDFVVTLGKWNGDQGGTQSQKIGTFVHELGHNLGLKHGGNEHTNYKTNHLSVMNYLYQTRGILVGTRRTFDYQRFPLPRLNERSLRETDGLCRTLTEVYNAIYYTSSSNFIEVPCQETMDWNKNGRIDETPVSADLNGDTLLTDLFSTPNEWGQVVYNGGAVGATNDLNNIIKKTKEQFEQQPFIELSEELNKQIDASLRKNMPK